MNSVNTERIHKTKKGKATCEFPDATNPFFDQAYPLLFDQAWTPEQLAQMNTHRLNLREINGFSLDPQPKLLEEPAEPSATAACSTQTDEKPDESIDTVPPERQCEFSSMPDLNDYVK